MAKTDKVTNTGGETTATLNCLYLSYQSCYFTYQGKEYSLHNNETYELPDCKFVQSLIKQGRLTIK